MGGRVGEGAGAAYVSVKLKQTQSAIVIEALTP